MICASFSSAADTDPTPEACRAHFGDNAAAAWIEDDKLFAAVTVENKSAQVMLVGPLQETLHQLADSDIWFGAFPLDDLDEAVMSLQFLFIEGRDFNKGPKINPLRGPKAPPAPKIADPLVGSITPHQLGQDILGESRTVSVYLPPNTKPKDIERLVFLADGQALGKHAAALEPLVVSKQIPPTAIIAVDNGGVDRTKRGIAGDYRAMEYLKEFELYNDAVDPARFAKHWKFFTEFIPKWASEQGFDVPPADRIVCGASNAGVFSATALAEAPEVFANAIVCSTGWLHAAEFFDGADKDKYLHHFAFFSAGSYETGMHPKTIQLKEAASAAGCTAVFESRVAGHDWYVWREQFVRGMLWINMQRAALAAEDAS
jgi:enterochelin esterase-like enzyme